ncbi:MAG TPA: VanZ family protein [Aggregatilinea sp.]|uniref:VanZ family protein n=1 Tax=Aggregatilinea sp. TaxID=2806333 RepID=UPI002C05345B|nr:VanZ family protein [Aggregatilinea sp.]HML23804.1 VanZ family protein [Aggregatilinea sp.]
MKRLNRLTPYFQHPLIRWALTLTWTATAASLMLSPSGEGTTVTWVSKLFGGTETTDAVGHVIINSILGFLWAWTMSLYTSSANTTRIVLVGGLIWGFTAEGTQYFVPGRGTSLLDLAANILGVSVGVSLFRLFIHYAPDISTTRQNPPSAVDRQSSGR